MSSLANKSKSVLEIAVTIERIDFWDRCLGAGRFDSAVKNFPDEALALFGACALQKRDPTALAFIVFARRILLMTDDQINQARARIYREAGNSEVRSSGAIHHLCDPSAEIPPSVPPSISWLSGQNTISEGDGAHILRGT